MNVDTVLSSLQERDKWRRRLALLSETLQEIRARRSRVQARLKRIRLELRRLGQYSDAILGQATTARTSRTYGTDAHLPTR